jgi:hypothetical protein
MNIVKGCIIDCELLLEGAVSYVPARVKVVNDEYLNGPKGNTYHAFDVTVLEHHSESSYNKYFPINETIACRAGDLYNGEIVGYPDNYDELCEEKAFRKQSINPRPPGKA